MSDRSAKTVSWESEELILVDENDTEIGTLSKAESHDGVGVLHRAFSLFLFDDAGRVLLQQRAASKRLWPLYWSNSVCSHPRTGETVAEAVGRRVHDELSLDGLEPEFVYKFRYQAPYRERGAEHELCHVFLARLPARPDPNRSEIAALRMVDAATLTRELEQGGDGYTPWFRMEWRRLNEEFGHVLGRYTRAADGPADQPT